jgi:hypothetical protein
MHCNTITECYHILQYEFHKDSHKTSKQEMEEFQLYMITSHKIV